MVETDLSAPVIEWLSGRGFVSYCEVPWFGRPIDIVALNGDVLEAVELKLTLSKAVLYQANLAMLVADSVWCVIATAPRNLDERLGGDWAKGLGVVRVVGGRVDVLREPQSTDRPAHSRRERLLETLSQLVPGGIAGSPTCAGSGPAQTVFNAIARYRDQHPSATWAELFKNVPNHYSHARSMQGAMRVVEERRAWRERKRLAKALPLNRKGEE